MRDGFTLGERLTDFTTFDITVERVETGGFGVVAMGPDRMQDGEWLVVKIPRPDLLERAGEEAQARLHALFLHESLTWMGLWPHANVLRAQFVSLLDDTPTLQLDYAQGGSLRDHFVSQAQTKTPIPLPHRLWWAQHIAAGLVSLHAPDPDHLRNEPIVHRDLKPENILILHNSLAAITDFGLANTAAKALIPTTSANATDTPSTFGTIEKPATGSHTEAGSGQGKNVQSSHWYRTQRGMALGTPAYMAPEQWLDASLAGTPADMYAFGVILAELLTDYHPLLNLAQNHSLRDWRQAHLEMTPVTWPTSLPPSLVQLSNDCLSKQPDMRPTAKHALKILQGAARMMGMPVYTVTDAMLHTDVNEQSFWHNWSVAVESFDMLDEALVRNERALVINPKTMAVRIERGNILQAMGRLDEAMVYYADALAESPGQAGPSDEGRKGQYRDRSVLFRSSARSNTSPDRDPGAQHPPQPNQAAVGGTGSERPDVMSTIDIGKE